MSLTAKELAAIEDQLGVEQTLIKKFTMYAHMASDPQLRTQFSAPSESLQPAACTAWAGRRQVSMRQIPFGDREMMEDALASQKFAAHGYNLYANECVSPAVMGELMTILNEEHQIQHEVFDEMLKRGWYTSEPVQQAQIDACRRRFGQSTASV
jgi:hypothetical protein